MPRNQQKQWNSLRAVRSAGFIGFKPMRDLRANRLRDVPKLPGVYLILCTCKSRPGFRKCSSAGVFKRRDPSVTIRRLNDKWINGACIVYIGKAGAANGRATLQSRLNAYLRHGAGEPVGHWGGRFIWQMNSSDSLLVCWRATTPAGAPRLERELLRRFAAEHGRLPFANLRH